MVDFIDFDLFRTTIPSEQTKIAEQLKSFYLNYHPDLIVMNASAGLFALKNKSYIEKVIREVEVFLCISDGMLQNERHLPTCPISIVDDTIPSLKAEGNQGQEEFRDLEVKGRVAIYMGRYIQVFTSSSTLLVELTL